MGQRDLSSLQHRTEWMSHFLWPSRKITGKACSSSSHCSPLCNHLLGWSRWALRNISFYKSLRPILHGKPDLQMILVSSILWYCICCPSASSCCSKSYLPFIYKYVPPFPWSLPQIKFEPPPNKGDRGTCQFYIIIRDEISKLTHYASWFQSAIWENGPWQFFSFGKSNCYVEKCFHPCPLYLSLIMGRAEGNRLLLQRHFFM